MNKEVVEVVAIIDKSGSMNEYRDSAIKGFNKFIDSQKGIEGTANLTTVLFSEPDKIKTLYQGDLKKSPKLDASNYTPRYGTAILDALGDTVTETDERLRQILGHSEFSRVVVVLLTDGKEGESNTWDTQSIEKLVKRFKRLQWEFILIGPVSGGVLGKHGWSNIHDTGKNIGIDHVFELKEGAEGIEQAFEDINKSVTNYRSERMRIE